METTIRWQWEEAFDKFGFGDGDDANFTHEVEDFLQGLGWNAVTDWWGMHNYMIMELTGPNGEKPMADCKVGYDCPRTYLPKKLIEKLDEKFPLFPWLGTQNLNRTNHMPDQRVLYLIHQVLETEIGTFANNFNWQKHWGLSNQEYDLLQKSRSRLTLKDS